MNLNNTFSFICISYARSYVVYRLDYFNVDIGIEHFIIHIQSQTSQFIYIHHVGGSVQSQTNVHMRFKDFDLVEKTMLEEKKKKRTLDCFSMHVLYNLIISYILWLVDATSGSESICKPQWHKGLLKGHIQGLQSSPTCSDFHTLSGLRGLLRRMLCAAFASAYMFRLD